jgi:SAM-dependent methyltransferase
MTNTYYHNPKIAEAYDVEVQLSRDVVVDDIPFYLNLARKAAARGESVLELGAGTGRVTIPIAREGIPIVGLEIAPAMLEVARRKSTGLDNLRLLEGDMADFQLQERFGLVIIPFRSFQLLSDASAQASCLWAIYNHLVEGGRLSFNIGNPAVFMPAVRASAQTGPFQGLEVGRDTFIIRPEGNLRVRWQFNENVAAALETARFAVESLSGWFDGRPFLEQESTEMIWIARKLPDPGWVDH